jgi:hypothetical protein
LKIVTETHPAEGESVVAAPVFYHFSPLYHAAGLIYLTPIALAFGLLKENKKGSALLILLPLVLVWGIWRGFAAAMGIPDESMSLLSAIVIALLTGFTAVWLLGERIGHRHRFITFLLAAVVMLLCNALMLVEIETPRYRLQIALFEAVSLLVLLGGFVFGGVLCRKRFGAVRFVLGTGCGILLTTLLVLGVIVAAQMYNHFSLDMLLMVLVQILIFALAYNVVVLPFLVLFFVNDFWRRRFAAVMGMGGAAVLETVPEGAAEGIGQG